VFGVGMPAVFVPPLVRDANDAPAMPAT
jgi:hypothetical protein